MTCVCALLWWEVAAAGRHTHTHTEWKQQPRDVWRASAAVFGCISESLCPSEGYTMPENFNFIISRNECSWLEGSGMMSAVKEDTEIRQGRRHWMKPSDAPSLLFYKSLFDVNSTDSWRCWEIIFNPLTSRLFLSDGHMSVWVHCSIKFTTTNMSDRKPLDFFDYWLKIYGKCSDFLSCACWSHSIQSWLPG